MTFLRVVCVVHEVVLAGARRQTHAQPRRSASPTIPVVVLLASIAVDHGMSPGASRCKLCPALYATLGPGAYITGRACRLLISPSPSSHCTSQPSRPNHHYYSSTSLTRLTPPFYIQYDEAHRPDWPPPRLALRDVQRTRRCQPQRHGLALQLAFEHPARLSNELASRTFAFFLPSAPKPLN